MRDAFFKSLFALMQRDPLIIAISGDVGGERFSPIQKEFPGRFFNFGIREQCMIGAAAGMAAEGLHPVVYTITPFLIERPFEQIKLDIDQQKLPVGLVGFADYPDAGPTHREIDAPKLMSLCPNITSLFPKHGYEVENFMAKTQFESPWFISLKKEPVVYEP